MKTNLKRQLSLFVIALMLLSPLALAPSHPVFIDENGQTVDTILNNHWADYGTLPGSFLWNVDIWWEDVTNVPPNEQLMERLAEAHVELTAGNIQAAQQAMAAAQQNMAVVEQELQAVEGSSDTFNQYVNLDRQSIVAGEQVDALAYELGQAETVGIVAADSSVVAAVNNLQEAATNVQAAATDLRQEVVDSIVQDQGITQVEAENTVETNEHDAGLAQVHELEVQNTLDNIQQELNQLNEEIDTAAAAGQTVDTATQQLAMEATARLEHAQEAVADEHFGEAFGQLTASEHIIENAQAHQERQETLPADLEPTAVREERISDLHQLVEETKTHPDLIINNPELADNVEAAQQELQVEDQVTALLAEGQSPGVVYDAAAQELTGFVYSDVPYTPPGIEREGDRITTSGGFVEGFSYADPVTGSRYEFTDTGVKVTSPLGVSYDQAFPAGFVVPQAFEKGTEEHTYSTRDGNKFTYTPVGYSVTKPDGTTENFAYDLGNYQLPGDHGEMRVEPAGIAFINERGREQARLEYVPEYKSYVSTVDGAVFQPAEGQSIHEGAMHYDYDAHNYVFDPARAAQFLSEEYTQYAGFAHEGTAVDRGGSDRVGRQFKEEWTYDPVTNAWSNPATGESHQAEATMIAPVGHEDKGSFTTETGEAWTYDGGSWKSDKGELFTPGEKDKATGEYQDVSGKTYEYHQEGKYVDSSTGAAWSYDASSHSWNSESGAAGTATGAAPGGSQSSVAGSVAPSTGTAVDAKGNVWSYNPGTGQWASPTAPAEGGHGPEGSGGYTGPPAGTDVGGHTEGGSYSGGYSSGGYSGGGSYSGGSYSGGTDSSGGHSGDMGGGSYSGGSSGSTGSSSTGGYSGGDSGGGSGGGSSGSSGGGDGGGGMGGMSANSLTGSVAQQQGSSRELSPVTRWIMRYTGMERK